jgi:hypothetical protein
MTKGDEMKQTGSLKIALVMLLTMPLAAMAQQTPQPDGPRRDPRDMRDFGPGRFGGGFFRRPPSPEEMESAMNFMKEYSPKRWDAMQKLSKERQDLLKDAVYRRFRMLEVLRVTDDQKFPIYELQLKRVATEDEIFGLTRDLRTCVTGDESKIKAKLHDKIAELVDLGIQERKIRIARWQKQLSEEQEKLAHDVSSRDDVIRKRMRVAEREDGTLGSDAADDANSQPANSPTTRASGDQ